MTLFQLDQQVLAPGQQQNLVHGGGTGPGTLPADAVATSANFAGSYQKIAIDQDGEGNTLNAFVAVRTTATASFDAAYVGDFNTHTANIYANDGVAPVANQFNSMDYKLRIEGDGNSVTDRLIGLTLIYDGDIEGDDNVVSMARGNAQGNLSFTYKVDGSRNNVSVSGGAVNQDRTLKLLIEGNDNTFVQTTSGAATDFDGTYRGDFITSAIDQTNSVAVVDVTKALGNDPLTVNLTQADGAYANVTLTAEGGGSWIGTQSAGAFYVQNALTLAAGGTGTVTQ